MKRIAQEGNMTELNVLPVELRAVVSWHHVLRDRWQGASVVGIDVGVDALRACCVHRVASGVATIVAHARVALPYTTTLDAALANHEAFCDAARTLHRMLVERGMSPRAHAVLGVRDPDAVFVRRMLLPLGDVADLAQEVRGQLGQVLPRASGAMLAGWEPLRPAPGVHTQIAGTVAAILRERVVALRSAFTAASFRVAAVEPSAWGLRRVGQRMSTIPETEDAPSTELFIDIGAAVASLVVFRGRDILGARDLPVGTDRFGRAIRDALAASEKEDRATLEAILVPSDLAGSGLTSPEAQDAAVACAMELYEAYDELRKAHAFPAVDHIVLSGVGARIDLIRRVIMGAFSVAVEPSLLDPPDFLIDLIFSEAERTASTAAVGHALRTDWGPPAIAWEDVAHAVTRDGIHLLPPPIDPYRASRRELHELFLGLEALHRAGVIRTGYRREFADIFGRFSGDPAAGSRKFRLALGAVAMEIRSSDVSWARALRRHLQLPSALAHLCDHIAAHPGEVHLGEMFTACAQFLAQRRSTAAAIDALLARVPHDRWGS